VIHVAAALLRVAVEIVHVLLRGDVREAEHAGAPLAGMDWRILERGNCSYFAAAEPRAT
jgi:hypothetical protein